MYTTLKNSRGITLVEMLVTVVVIGILTTTSFPAMGRLIESTRMSAAHSALMVALNRARAAAVEHSAYAEVCPSTDGNQCTGDTQWQSGWIVFIDENKNKQHDAEEPLLEVSAEQGPHLAIISSSGRDHVRYNPDGSAPGTNLTITFCDARGADEASTVVVNNVGRIRSGKPNANAAANACAMINI